MPATGPRLRQRSTCLTRTALPSRFAAADDQVLHLRHAGHGFSRRRSLRRTMGRPLPDLHACDHASHRIRDHHGLQCQPNVSATASCSVHQRAASISLNAPGFAVSETVQRNFQGASVHLAERSGAVRCNPCWMPPVHPLTPPSATYLPTTTPGPPTTPMWPRSANYGFVVARNPGVTNVYATLNGTVSAPLAFVTCPPSSIVLASSAVHRYGTDATLLDGRSGHSAPEAPQEYVTATHDGHQWQIP